MDDDVKDLLLLAIVELRNGNPDEALLILERTVYPKFDGRSAASLAAISNSDYAVRFL